MDSAQRRLAERRLLAALRRLHRREPVRADFRADTVLRELRADAGEKHPPGHRGGGSLREVGDAELLEVVDLLAASGRVFRRGRGLSLPEREPILADPEMRGRVGQLLAVLREAGAEPPRVDSVASHLGVPPGVIAQLRSAGELVQMTDGIDYPRSVADPIRARLDAMEREGRLSMSGVRDELGVSRRYAEALIEDHARSRRNATG